MLKRKVHAFTLALVVALVAIAASAAPSGAMTLDQAAQQVSGIPNSKWTTGSMGQTYGTNCSTAILGSSYPEIMVMAFSGYGGKPGTVRVGDDYWAMVHLAVTGNPCPHGSDIIAIDLALPPGTSIDGTRQIRCFSTPRLSDDYYESTNETWDMRPIGVNAYGRSCPTGLTPSATGHGVGLDFRGLASGQNFVMYVPVRSTQQLVGMGSSDHRFVWLVKPFLAYDYFGTESWANIFPAGPSNPYIYFTRDPSVVPFWDAGAPAGQQNRAELFANLYSNFETGTFCYRLYAGPSASGVPILDCAGFNGTINATSDSWFTIGNGPNGSAVPFYFDPPEYGQTFTVQWYFDRDVGSTIESAPITFRALSGPDDDADGVANDGTDQCPTEAGGPPRGCPTAKLQVSDPDGDGVIGGLDNCPSFAAIGAADGCPKLTAGFGKLPKFKRSSLRKGLKFPVTCSLDAPASASLAVTRSNAKKLKLKVKKGAKSVTLASAKGTCRAGASTKLKLKLTSKAKTALKKYKKSVKATLTVSFKPAGGVAPATRKKSVTLK